MPSGTADLVGAAFNFLHSGAPIMPTQARNLFSQHFAVLALLYSPILAAFRNPLAIIMAETFVLATLPVAAYCLCFVLTGSSQAGFIAMLLSLSTPYLYELLTASYFMNSLPALMVWMFFFWYRRRWVGFLAFAFLSICSGEQIEIFFAGLGLYSIHALGWRKPRSWAVGLGLCAASLVLFRVELSVIHHFALKDPAAPGDSTILQKVEAYRQLVPNDVPPENILGEVVFHPLRTSAAAFRSIDTLYPTFRQILFVGLLPLLSPLRTILFLMVAMPNILAYHGAKGVTAQSLLGPVGSQTALFNFALNYSAMVLGPLIWATCWGIRWAYARLTERAWEAWLLVWALLFASLGFRFANRTLLPDFRPSWFDRMPAMLAKIPPDAKVWTDEYATPPLSTRRWLAIVGWGPNLPAGYQHLFRPDYVLIEWAFPIIARPPYRDRVLTFLAQNHYEKIAEDAPLILLKAPRLLASRALDRETLQLPLADPRRASAYSQYLLRRLDGMGRLDFDSLEIYDKECKSIAAQGRWNAAAKCFSEILFLNPDFAKAELNLGIVNYELANYKESLAHFTRALNLRPDDSNFHRVFGKYLAGMGDFQAAVAQFKLAAALRSRFVGAPKNSSRRS